MWAIWTSLYNCGTLLNTTLSCSCCFYPGRVCWYKRRRWRPVWSRSTEAAKSWWRWLLWWFVLQYWCHIYAYWLINFVCISVVLVTSKILNDISRACSCCNTETARFDWSTALKGHLFFNFFEARNVTVSLWQCPCYFLSCLNQFILGKIAMGAYLNHICANVQFCVPLMFVENRVMLSLKLLKKFSDFCSEQCGNPLFSNSVIIG